MAVILTFVLYIVVIGLIYYCVLQIPLPPPFPVIIKVAFILLVIYVILALFGMVGGGIPRLRL